MILAFSKPVNHELARITTNFSKSHKLHTYYGQINFVKFRVNSWLISNIKSVTFKLC